MPTEFQIFGPRFTKKSPMSKLKNIVIAQYHGKDDYLQKISKISEKSEGWDGVGWGFTAPSAPPKSAHSFFHLQVKGILSNCYYDLTNCCREGWGKDVSPWYGWN